jgi:hypothetical protein
VKLWDTWHVRYAYPGAFGVVCWLGNRGGKWVQTEDPQSATGFGSRGVAIDVRDQVGEIDGVRGKIVIRRGLRRMSLAEYERREQRGGEAGK